MKKGMTLVFCILLAVLASPVLFVANMVHFLSPRGAQEARFSAAALKFERKNDKRA